MVISADITARPMATKSGGNPNIDTQRLNYHVDVVWTWPTPYQDWTKFRLVRRAGSPAERVEEGRRVMETTREAWTQYLEDGRPWYRDLGSVPDEWNFYTAFVMGRNRVWHQVGIVAEIGIGDHGWATRLPEFLPGAATANDRGTAHPAEQGNVLVNFLQPMGVFMDRVVSMAEGARMFLDPRKCAPRMLQFLVDTYGFASTGILTMARTREVAYAIRRPNQGMLSAIHTFSAAATGCRTTVTMSDNLFLNVNDSSFEMGPTNRYNCGWDDIDDIEVIAYQSGDIGLLPPNVHRKFYAKVQGGKTIRCGTAIDYTKAPAPGAPYRTFNPVGAGIPMQTWEVVRMSCYAAKPTLVSGSLTLRMGIDMYDVNGVFIHALQVFESTTVGSVDWDWYGNKTPAVVNVVVPELQVLPSDRLTNPSLWKQGVFLYAGPQTTLPAAASNIVTLTWTQAPATDMDTAFWGISTNVLVGATYEVSVTVESVAGSPKWRPAIGNKAYGATSTGTAGTETIKFDWVADGQTCMVGVEALRGVSGWSGSKVSKVRAITLTRKTVEPAYAVPWLFVSKDCYVDLLVIDDGR